MHYGGANLSDIYYTLASEDDKEYQQVKEKLEAHFEPKVNVTFETYNFRQLAQEQDESEMWQEKSLCKEVQDNSKSKKN